MVWNSQFPRDGKTSHSPGIWMSARHGVAAAENFGQRESVAATKKFWSKREKVLEDDVFIENTVL